MLFVLSCSAVDTQFTALLSVLFELAKQPPARECMLAHLFPVQLGAAAAAATAAVGGCGDASASRRDVGGERAQLESWPQFSTLPQHMIAKVLQQHAAESTQFALSEFVLELCGRDLALYAVLVGKVNAVVKQLSSSGGIPL